VNFLASLEKRSQLFWILVGIGFLAGVGALDLWTGYEYALSFFYLIPVSLITWFTGRRLGIAASIAAALIWLVTDVAAGHVYSERFIYVWNTLIILGVFVVVALLLSALRKALENERELAHTDYLTGAMNSRLFFDLMQMEVNRSQRYKHPFTIAYIDIDNFKTINDRFGHTAGDQVLRTLVDQVNIHLRKTDMIARLGGDEFALLLPETDQESAQVVLPKIQQDILTGMQQNHWPVTISIGVLTCIQTPLTAVEIIQRVDDLMYSVKRGNKNAIKYSTYEG